VSVWAVSALRRPEARAVARFDITPGGDQALPRQITAQGALVLAGVPFDLAPDGSWIVYVGAAPGGRRQLWRRSLDALEAVALPGTEGAAYPVVSPDGQRVAFVVDGSIRTLSLSGGPQVTVVEDGATPAWGSDGMIYFSRDGIVYRVPAGGGDPVALSAPSDNVVQAHLDALPDGRGVLISAVVGTPATTRIAVVGPEGGQLKEILTATMARYSATGHIVYATPGGTLMAAPFDLRSLDVSGPAVPLVDGVAVERNALSWFALSESGTLLYGTGAGFRAELVWVGRDGRVEPLDSSWTGEFAAPALSPDGTRLAVAIQSATSMDVWVRELDRGTSTRLTLDGNRSDYPTWTPDGRSITFTSDRASPSFDLWTKRADGSGEPVLEVDEASAVAEGLWSPDGQWFIHRTSTNVPGAGDIVGQRVSGDTTRVPLAATGFTELAPAISPNGRWMAFSSSETGRAEIFVVPFPNTSDAKWRVSVDGGIEPLWSGDGRELFYRTALGTLVAARVESGPTFSVGATSVLFRDTQYARNGAHHQYDVTPDGQRFLMIRPVGVDRPSRLILVQNAFEELKRTVPN
jgi:serine/threonine-protein kinase